MKQIKGGPRNEKKWVDDWKRSTWISWRIEKGNKAHDDDDDVFSCFLSICHVDRIYADKLAVLQEEIKQVHQSKLTLHPPNQPPNQPWLTNSCCHRYTYCLFTRIGGVEVYA